MLETLIAYGITFLIGTWLVKVQVKEDEKKKRIEDDKVMRLKSWLIKCAESRKSEENRRRL